MLSNCLNQSMLSRLLVVTTMAWLMVACQTGQPVPDDDSAFDSVTTAEEEAALLEAQRLKEEEELRQQIEAARLEAEQKALNERYQQAMDALKGEEFALAAGLLSDLQSQQAELPLVSTNLGLALLAMKDWQQAENAFRQAITEDSGNAIAHNHLAVVQRHQGKFNEALTSYQAALAINPDYATAHLNLAILYDIYLQDLPSAVEHYELYMELQDEEDKLVNGWLTDLKRRLGKE